MVSRPLTSVLVANRGEIAARIFRTAKRLGMRTVAVHSDADRDALFVALADEAHAIGSAPASESYLRIDRVVAAARRSGADCIHPGYGFLSEQAGFAEACTEAGIVFVGPPAEAIRAMGLKDAAKRRVEAAGVPVVPGYHGADQDEAVLREAADRIGYPVLIKAVAGGGGKGMRRVDDARDFPAALESARREAQSAFGDPRVLVERYVASPRHIEIQVFADQHGNVVSLFERDCSLQRRHQKVIEEAPAPGVPLAMREAMGRAAVEAARSVGYVGAGTVEFIADGRDGLRADRFYFMEMNTRLQVEHPVTEAITGLDLVELQFRVAAGEPLPLRQQDLAIRGHAVEARLYAEDPAAGFLPSTGRLWGLRLPEGEGIRVDAGVQDGDVVTPFYDPMIAKVIAHGETRDEALDRLGAALSRTVVAGPKTNVAFLRALCDAEGFRGGAFDTGFIDRHLDDLVGSATASEASIAAGVAALLDREMREAPLARTGTPWGACDAFQLGAPRHQAYPVKVDGVRVDVAVAWPGPMIVTTDPVDPAHAPVVICAPHAVYVVEGGRQVTIEPFDPFDVDLDQATSGGAVKAPMHGRLIALLVAVGDQVEKGQRLAVVEAMKMEHALLAPRRGRVVEIGAEAGAQVAEGARLVTLSGPEDHHD